MGGNAMFKVESGLPVEKFGRRRYPFARLEPGDSFFVPAATADERRLVRHAAMMFKRSHPGWFYTTRVVVSARSSGVRVWRVRGEERVS
jgi:hypothetical protein